MWFLVFSPSKLPHSARLHPQLPVIAQRRDPLSFKLETVEKPEARNHERKSWLKNAHVYFSQARSLSEELASEKAAASTLRTSVAFDFGTPNEAGAFVGRTFSSLFDTASQSELSEVEAGLRSVEIDVLSLGPFIQEAEVFESDPIVFAQFQSSLVGELLQLDLKRQEALRSMLEDSKAKASGFPVGSDEWNNINNDAYTAMEQLLTKTEQAEMTDRMALLSEHGMLVIPTYSILQ